MSETIDDPVVPLYLLIRDLKESVEKLVKDAASAKQFIPDYDPEAAEEWDVELSALTTFVESLKNLPLELLPREIAERLSRAIRGISSTFEMIRRGRASLEPQRLDEMWSKISDGFKTCLNILHEWLPLLALARTPIADLSSLRSEFEQLASDQQSLPQRINDIVSNAVRDFTGELEQIRALKAAAQDAVGEIGVDKHTVNFSKVRDDHAKWARCWLIFSGAIVLITLSTPFWLPHIFVLNGDWSQPENVQKIGFKVLFLSTLIYVGAQSLKTYRTHRHLEEVNLHRATSLLTFRTFVDSATDEQIKSTVLLEAARTVFSPVATGYIRGQEDDPDNRLYELAQLLRGK